MVFCGCTIKDMDTVIDGAMDCRDFGNTDNGKTKLSDCHGFVPHTNSDGNGTNNCEDCVPKMELRLNVECLGVVSQCQCNMKENGIINGIELGKNCLNNSDRVDYPIWTQMEMECLTVLRIPRQCFHDYHSSSCGVPKNQFGWKGSS